MVRARAKEDGLVQNRKLQTESSEGMGTPFEIGGLESLVLHRYSERENKKKKSESYEITCTLTLKQRNPISSY